MGWGSIIATILGLLAKLFGVTTDKTPEAQAEATGEAAGVAKQQAATAEKEIGNVAAAEAARATVRAELERDPSSVRTDDGFRRD